MKANQVNPQQKFSTKHGYHAPNLVGIVRHGVIVSNQSRQGDEVVIVEWDDNFQVQAMNVNDLDM